MNFDPATTSLADLERMLTVVCSKIEGAALEHARSRSDYDELKNFEKVLLAIHTPEEGTQLAKTNAALKSNEYKIHLEGLAAARKKANEDKAKLDALTSKFEALRTIISARKQEMKSNV